MFKISFAFIFLVSILQKTKGEEDSLFREREKAFVLLDVAKDFISRAKKLYPECSDDNSTCSQKETSFAFLEVTSNLISEAKDTFPECSASKFPIPSKSPSDCFEVWQNGHNVSDVYTIWPRNRILPRAGIQVFCDMDTDKGGWTVIQRRGKFFNPPNYFYKDWETYKSGFGNIRKEFWMGNDNIFALSNQKDYSIRFDLEDSEGDRRFAHYHSFWIENEESAYTLRIGGFSGNAGNGMAHQNNTKFSTKDKVHESKTCPIDRQGGWWYSDCGFINLNGVNQPGVKDDQKGITWHEWKGYDSLARTEIKIKPRDTSS